MNIFAIQDYNAETPVDIEKDEDLEEITELIEKAKIADDDVGGPSSPLVILLSLVSSQN